MPVGVIYLFEEIDISHGKGDQLLGRLIACDDIRKPEFRSATVRQTRERIRARIIAKLPVVLQKQVLGLLGYGCDREADHTDAEQEEQLIDQKDLCGFEHGVLVQGALIGEKQYKNLHKYQDKDCADTGDLFLLYGKAGVEEHDQQCTVQKALESEVPSIKHGRTERTGQEQYDEPDKKCFDRMDIGTVKDIYDIKKSGIIHAPHGIPGVEQHHRADHGAVDKQEKTDFPHRDDIRHGFIFQFARLVYQIEDKCKKTIHVFTVRCHIPVLLREPCFKETSLYDPLMTEVTEYCAKE